MSESHAKNTETNVNLEVKDPKDNKLQMPRTADQKAFMRHDASYVCSVCKAKFFTKVDVEAHFLKHPLAEKVK